MKKLALFYIIILTFFTSIHGEEVKPLVIDAYKTFNPKGYLWHFEDTSNRLSFDSILSLKHKFELCKDQTPNYVYSLNNHWFYISIIDKISKTPLYNWISNPMLDTIEVFVTVNNKLTEHYITGDAFPFSWRPFKYHDFILKTPYYYKQEIYFRVRSTLAVSFPIEIMPEEVFIQKSNTVNWALGLYYGALLIMFFYNLFLFINLKDKNYLLYVSYLFCYGMSLLTFDGYAFQFLSPNNTWWANIQIEFWVTVSTLAGIIFSVSFLNIKKISKKWYTIFFVYFLIGCLLLLSVFVVKDINLIDLLTSTYSAIAAFLGIVIALIFSLKGIKTARYFMFAWFLMLISIIIYVLKDNNLLPTNNLTRYSLHIGSIVEMMLLSFALAYRINLLKEQKNKAQREVINQLKKIDEIKTKANIELEQKVKERTLDLFKQKQIIEQKNKDITDSINYALKIQQAVLSDKHDNTPEHFIWFKPKDIVSGDFYWQSVIDNCWYFAVADCTGHGVPGAFMSIMGISLLNEIVSNKEISPAQILNELRLRLINNLQKNQDTQKDGMDIALCKYNMKTGLLEYSGAYNPMYLLTKEKKQFSEYQLKHINTIQYNNWYLHEIKADRQPIGYHFKMHPFTNHSVYIKKGDLIYIFSDGFADQFGGAKNKKFKYSRLKDILLKIIVTLPVSEQKSQLIDIYTKWKGTNEQIDDICFMGVRF
jgi:serine phosphatase RsbU (regulator of sigma subunit)